MEPANSPYEPPVRRYPKYPGGIRPTASAYFCESKGEPTWYLKPFRIENRVVNRDFTKVWIPSQGNFLKDALLMIGVHELKIDSLKNKLIERLRGSLEDEVHLDWELSDESRHSIYQVLDEVEYDCKMLLWISSDSSLNRCISVMDEFDFESEILVSRCQ